MKTKQTTRKGVDVDKMAQAMMLKAKDKGMCPNCKSRRTCNDSPGTWLFLFSFILFPVSLVLLYFNRNRFCLTCGVRFKKLT
jgi:hypothetical protein